jgi:hypothetical protein
MIARPLVGRARRRSASPLAAAIAGLTVAATGNIEGSLLEISGVIASTTAIRTTTRHGV